jgi:hypothetical protein
MLRAFPTTSTNTATLTPDITELSILLTEIKEKLAVVGKWNLIKLEDHAEGDSGVIAYHAYNNWLVLTPEDAEGEIIRILGDAVRIKYTLNQTDLADYDKKLNEILTKLPALHSVYWKIDCYLDMFKDHEQFKQDVKDKKKAYYSVNFYDEEVRAAARQYASHLVELTVLLKLMDNYFSKMIALKKDEKISTIYFDEKATSKDIRIINVLKIHKLVTEKLLINVTEETLKPSISPSR